MGDLDRVTFGGQTVDRRTSNMLREAQRIANEQDPSIGKLHLSQGCFCHGVAASAGTHSGAGAFDLSVRGYSEHQKDVIALSLRKVGFASWRRMPNQGPWPEHIHGIAIGSKDLPSVAQSQVRSYLSGHDGLAGNRVDHQPRPAHLQTWEQYESAHPHDQPAADPHPTAEVPPAQTAPASDPYDIDTGHGVTAVRDSDGDGLTDDFEKLAHTNPFNADSNGNGITDGQEFVATGGRGTGMTIDADHDGVADWLETAAQNAAVARTGQPALNGQSAQNGEPAQNVQLGPNGQVLSNGQPLAGSVPGAQPTTAYASPGYGSAGYGSGGYGTSTYGTGAYGAGTLGSGLGNAQGFGAGLGTPTTGIGTGQGLGTPAPTGNEHGTAGLDPTPLDGGVDDGVN